jgi:hypothetical protein
MAQQCFPREKQEVRSIPVSLLVVDVISVSMSDTKTKLFSTYNVIHTTYKKSLVSWSVYERLAILRLSFLEETRVYILVAE